jgi:hypothetical protein
MIAEPLEEARVWGVWGVWGGVEVVTGNICVHLWIILLKKVFKPLKTSLSVTSAPLRLVFLNLR